MVGARVGVLGGRPGSILGGPPQCTGCPCGPCSRSDVSDGVGADGLQSVALLLVWGAAALVKLPLAVLGHPDLYHTVEDCILVAVLDHALAPNTVAGVVVAEGLLDSRALLHCRYPLGWLVPPVGGRMMRMPGPRGRGGPASGCWVGGGGMVGAGGQEAVALPSLLVRWRLGADVPLLLCPRLEGTGVGETGGAWAWKRGCVACWLGSRSGGSAGVCTVAFTRFCARSAGFRTVFGQTVDHGTAGGLLSKGWWR